jgi:hypothetical protein
MNDSKTTCDVYDWPKFKMLSLFTYTNWMQLYLKKLIQHQTHTQTVQPTPWKIRPNEQDKPVPCIKYNTYENINIF